MNSKKSIVPVLALVVLVLAGAPYGIADVQFTDTAGVSVTLPAPAERVVCLNSDSAEMMAAIGAGDAVVGLTDTAMGDPTLRNHLKNAVSVGDWQTPSPEKILQLSPDAVISYSSSKPKNADQLTNAGIRLIYLDCYRITTLEHDASALGTMTGHAEGSEKYLDFLKKWRDMVTSSLSGVAETSYPSVYVEGYTDFTAQGNGSGTDLMLDMAKGKNLAASLKDQWPKVTPEWVLKENPDIILKMATVKPDKTLVQVRNDLLGRNGFDTLHAVTSEKVYVLNGDLAYGPRSPAGLVYIARILHPDLFESVHPSDVLKEYAESFVSGTENGEYFAPDL